MKRILCSLLSILFVIGIFFSVPMTASAFYSDIKYLGTYKIEEQINPLYKGLVDESDYLTIKPDVYYSDGLDDFDANLYSSDKEVSATVIREGMEDRLATVTIYYKAEKEFEQNDFNLLFNELQELSFRETEIATQGDSLRYGYKSSSANIEGVSDGTNYYYKYIISYEYYTTAEEEAELTQKVEEVIANFGFVSATTEKAKSDAIYNYITDNVTYDNANLNDSTYYLKFTPYAALINKTAVCQGYAMLYYRLAEETGLDCRIVSGTSRDQNHAWNIVKLGDCYYYLDSTWDAGNTEYDYYLKGSADFSLNHTNEARFETTEFKSSYNISSENFINQSLDGANEYFYYTVDNNIATIANYYGTEEHVVVPSVLGGYPVQHIGYHAFYSNENIKEITFSEGIQSMSESAISSCINLTTVNYPSTMYMEYDKYGETSLSGYTTIPMYCDNISKVTVAQGNSYMCAVDGILYSADMQTVIYCPPASGKTNVVLPETITDIAPRAFDGCNTLTEVILPDTLKCIGYWSFINCANLTEIEIPENCEFIGQFAFMYTALKSFNVPKAMKTIMPCAFQDTYLESITLDPQNETFTMQNGALCKNTALIVYAIGSSDADDVFELPESITYIYPNAFNGARFKSVKFNDVIETIGSSAFSDCANLNHIEIPATVTTIEDYLFYDCVKLVSVIIPDSVTEISPNLFLNNKDAVTIYYETEAGSAYQYATDNSIKKDSVSNFNVNCKNGHNLVKTRTDKAYTFICSECNGEAEKQGLLDIYSATLELETNEFVYKQPFNPVVKSVNYKGRELVEGVDYVVVIPDNSYTLYVNGINDFTGTKHATITLKPADLNDFNISLEYDEIEYTGFYHRPKVEIEGLDYYYNVSYSDNLNAGTATVTITGNDLCKGTVTKTFKILPCDISNYQLQLEHDVYSYDGTPKTPAFSIYLEKGVDYTGPVYTNNINVGEGTVSITGIGNYKGTATATFIIIPVYLNGNMVNYSLEYERVVYDGKAKTPKVNVEGYTEGVDFEVEYTDNLEIGWPSVRVTFIGNYTGDFVTTFQIYDDKWLGEHKIELEKEEYTYTGSEIRPKVTIKGLTENVDFTVTYGSNLLPGQGLITVNGIGSYYGVLQRFFNIVEGPHTHNYTSTVTKQPTCTTAGVKTFTCSCSDSYTEAVSAKGHTEVTVTGKAVTCTQAGLTDGKKCSVCGTVTVAQQTIKATGHKEVVIPAVAPTLTTVGKTEGKKCSVCGTVTVAQKDVAKLTLATPTAKTANSAKGITVTWNAVENAEKYIVYQRVYNKTTKKYSGWKAIKTTTALSYTDTTVKLGTIYSHTVKAVSGSVQSKYTATTGLTYNVTPTVKVALASNGVKVSWTTAANATGYTVYSSTYNTKTKKWSGWTNRGTAKATATSWVDKNAKSGTQYKYTVKAMNNKVASSYNKTGASTLFLAQPTVKIANNASGMKVSWNKITGATGYTIYRAEYVNGKWSSWKNMGTIKKNATVSWVDKSVKSGTQYRYTVKAINGKVASTYKASNTLLYLAQPKTTVKAVSNGINVAWTQSAGATGFTVYRSEYNAKTKKWSGWKKMGTAAASKKNWTDKSAKKGVTYRYTVKAVNGSVASTYAASGNVKR